MIHLKDRNTYALPFKKKKKEKTFERKCIYIVIALLGINNLMIKIKKNKKKSFLTHALLLLFFGLKIHAKLSHHEYSALPFIIYVCVYIF